MLNNAFRDAPLNGAVVSKATYLRSLPPKLLKANSPAATDVRYYEYTTTCPYFGTKTTRRITWKWFWSPGSLSGEWKQTVEVLGGASAA